LTPPLRQFFRWFFVSVLPTTYGCQTVAVGSPRVDGCCFPYFFVESLLGRFPGELSADSERVSPQFIVYPSSLFRRYPRCADTRFPFLHRIDRLFCGIVLEREIPPPPSSALAFVRSCWPRCLHFERSRIWEPPFCWFVWSPGYGPPDVPHRRLSVRGRGVV